MTDVLGVAVVGVGEQQWSGVAHLPALASADGVQLVRLVTANPKSADRVYRHQFLHDPGAGPARPVARSSHTGPDAECAVNPWKQRSRGVTARIPPAE